MSFTVTRVHWQWVYCSLGLSYRLKKYCFLWNTHHYSERDERLKSPTSRLLTQPFIQAQIKGNINSCASLVSVQGIHRWPMNSPHKGPVTRKMFPFDDVIICIAYFMKVWWCYTECFQEQLSVFCFWCNSEYGRDNRIHFLNMYTVQFI